MKKVVTLLAAFILLGGCSGNQGSKQNQAHEKLHNKGVAIESHAPRHISDVTKNAASRASAASLKH